MNHNNDAEKGHDARYDYESKDIYGEAPVLGAATVAEAQGRGGETQRGLKSRHIQFL